MPDKRTGIKKKIAEHGICNQMLPRLLPIKDAAAWLGLTVWAIK